MKQILSSLRSRLQETATTLRSELLTVEKMDGHRSSSSSDNSLVFPQEEFKKAPTKQGTASVRLGLIIEGFYFDTAQPDRSWTVSAVNEAGEILASTSTNRPSINAPAEAPPRAGFRLDLPYRLLDGGTHRLRLLVDNQPSILGEVIIDGARGGEGCVDDITPTSIRGWAISFVKPNDPVVIEARLNGYILGSGRAATFRPDVAKVYRTSGFHGFEFNLVRTLSAAEIAEVTFHFSDCGTTLHVLENVRVKGQATVKDNNTKRYIGHLDRFDHTGVSGWALDTVAPNKPILVSLVLDGQKIGGILADGFRPDVAKIYASSGKHGFHISLPPGIDQNEPISAEITIEADGANLAGSPKSFSFEQKGLKHPVSNNFNSRNENYVFRASSKALVGPAGKIAVIIINLNGARHLERFFETFRKYNSYHNYTVFVVDHGSTDDSLSVIKKWTAQLNIKSVPRGQNFSFSQSNNFIADQSDADLLFFVNNDIAFSQDILTPLAQILCDPEVGVVGLKLLSMPELGRSKVQRQVEQSFVQHLGIKFDYDHSRPPLSCYELPSNSATSSIEYAAWEVPAVTGAALMMRREDFKAAGGFDEGFYYGYEDVDLCLTVNRLLNKKIVCANNTFAYHVRGATRSTEDDRTRARFAKNFQRLLSRHGAAMRSAIRQSAVRGETFYRAAPLKIAFAVSTVDMEAPEADFFTAYELGEYLAELYGWEVTYLPPENWYNLGAFDVVVAMRHDFDVRKIRETNWNLTVIAWPRNWFDRWLSSPWIGSFDAIWTASKKSIPRFEELTNSPVDLLPIATNPRRFNDSIGASSDLMCDYCFTGSFFGAPRDIIRNIDPDGLPFDFGLFGHNWENVAWLTPYWRGPLPYSEIPNVYASTKIVIDDANHTVKAWGSVNSRVFDAIASGCLVITNDPNGNRDILGGVLPVAEDAATLKAHLEHYLSNEGERLALVEKAQAIVLGSHTYRHRADAVFNFVSKLMHQRRIVVRDMHANGTPSAFSDLMARQLQTSGQKVKIQLGGPAQPTQDAADIIIHLSTEPSVSSKLDEDKTHVRVHVGALDDISLSEANKFDLLVLANGKIDGAKVPTLALFDDPKKVPILTISDEGDIVCADLRPYTHALEALLPNLLKQIESIHQAKHAASPSARAGKSGSASIAIQAAPIDLLFWPDYSSTNPYQRLIYNGLSEHIYSRPGTIENALAMQSEQRSSPVVFHLHWTSPIIGLPEAEIIAVGRAERFISQLDAFQATGGRFIWTIHNVVPHETPFPAAELSLCNQLAARADVIHVHSSKVPELAANSYTIPSDKTVVGKHGSYLTVYPSELTKEKARELLGFSQDAIVLIFFGQIRSYKGIDDLLDAFAEVEAGNERSLKLLIVGKPVHINAQDLRSRIDKYPSVTLAMNEIPDTDIQRYLRAADFMILPYRKVLTSGSAYLGLSFGLPIIAPNSGLLPEIIDESCGYLFNTAISDGLVQAINWARSRSEDERAQLQAGATARAEALSWNNAQQTIASAVRALAVGVPMTIQVGDVLRRCFVYEPSDKVSAKARVACIVLHYQHLDDTIRCVTSLLNQNYLSQHIYIVSNDESSDAFVTLSKLFPLCTVIQSPDNLGYAGGNNIALALSRLHGAELFWIVNPDTVAPRDYLSRMVQLADTRPESSLFGSTIVFGDRPDVVWFSGGKIDFDDGLETSHTHIGRKISEIGTTPVSCDYITGASLLGRTTVVDQVGYIPEDYFLYFEESHWCLEAKRKGLDLTIAPQISIEHHKRSEDGGAPTLTFLYYYCRNALLMCAKFEPRKMENTELKIREKVTTWLQRVASVRPHELQQAKAIVEKGVKDGHQGRSGRVNFLAELTGYS